MLNLNFRNGNTPALNARNLNAIVEAINTMQTQLANPFTYKGVVASVANLPSSGNTINDTYYVTAETCLYSWNGTAWSVASMSESEYLAMLQNILDDIAAEYDSTSTYSIGDYCIYNEKLYRCITAITTAEAWTAGHWVIVDVMGEVIGLKNDTTNGDEARKLLYTGENALDLNDITPKSRIRTDNGSTSVANTFFSTGYIPVRFGMKVVLNKSYDSSAYGTAFYDVDKQYISGASSVASNLKIDVPQNSAFMRTCFSESDADSATVIITAPVFDNIDGEIEEINTAIENINTGNKYLEDATFSVFDVDWDVIASGNFPFGWRAGFWSDSGERTNSSSYIMSTSKLSSFAGTRPVLSGGLFANVSLPEGKQTLRVKAFDSTTGTMVANLFVHNGDTFQILEGCYYGFHMTGTESEITQEFVDNIKVSVHYKDTNNKMPYRNVYERFNVEVNLNWPNPGDTSTDNNETENTTSVRGIITLPNSYLPAGNPTPLIMMCHGYNGHVSEKYWNENGESFIALLNAFKSAGFAVFDVDNTRSDADGYADWGCLPLMSSYIKAWEYIKKNYNVEKRLYLYSYSMGTPVALNMIKWYGSEIVTSVQTACRPICQLRYEAFPSGDTRQKQFAVAFALCSEEDAEASDWVAPAWDTQRLRGFNQLEEAVNINEVDIINMKTPPIKVLIGGDDTDFQTQAISYYNALANNGNFVNMRVVNGMNHGAIGYLTNANLRDEVVNWFKRFRN